MNQTTTAESAPTGPVPPRLLRVRDASEELTVSERHFRQLILDGRVAAVRIGRCLRVPRAEVERLIREGV